MRLALAIVAILLVPTALPAAPAEEAIPRVEAWRAPPAHEPSLLPWAMMATAYAAGAPHEGWPRPAPAFASDPVAGKVWVGLVGVANVGTQDFNGWWVFEVVELGFLRRWDPFPLSPVWALYPLMNSEAGLIFFLPVPDPAPATLTLRVWFERLDGSPVGARIDQTFRVLGRWCGASHEPHMTIAAGSQDVWFPWDQPWYTVAFCNPTDKVVRVAVLARDDNTGRPLLLHSDSFLLPYAVAQGLVWPSPPFDPDYPTSTSQYLTILPGYTIGYTAFLEETPFLIDYSPPVDIAPIFTLLWDDGRQEEVRGGPVTFAGVSPPDLPLPPVEGL